MDEDTGATHLHPSKPPAPCIPLKMPAAMRPPNPFAMVLPQYSTATRGAISCGLYHELTKRLYNLSARELFIWWNTWILQCTWEKGRLCKSQKHTNHHYTSKVLCRRSAHRYSSPYKNSNWDISGWFDSSQDNITGNLAKEIPHELVILSVWQASMPRRFKLTIIATAVWYWVSERPRSLCIPPSRALAIFERSRMLKINNRHNEEIKCRSIFLTTVYHCQYPKTQCPWRWQTTYVFSRASLSLLGWDLRMLVQILEDYPLPRFPDGWSDHPWQFPCPWSIIGGAS